MPSQSAPPRPAPPQPAAPRSLPGRLLHSLRALAKRTPLRVKLVTAMLALVAVALTVISAASVAIYHNYLLGQANQQLISTFQSVLQEAQSRQSLPMRPGDIGPIGYNTVLILRPANGRLDPSDRRPSTLPNVPLQASWLAAHASQPVTVSSIPSGHSWLVITQQLWYQSVNPLSQQISRQRVTLIVGMDLSTIDRTIGRLIYIDIVASLIIMTALAMAGVAAVRQSLRPLSGIEKTAQAIAAGDLSRRVPDADPRTELGSLGHSLNSMLAQIEAAFHARAESEAAARQSEERMRRFIADASHELRTPLTAIRGYAEYYRQRGGIPGGEAGGGPAGAESRNGAAAAPGARDTAGGPATPATPATPAAPGHAGTGAQGLSGAGAISGADMNRIMDRVEQESARMGVLVEDLLLLARLDQQRPLDRRPVDLLSLAADAVQDARMIAPSRAIDLAVTSGTAFLVLGDEVRLRQVIGNLMSNALTHTPDGTPVRVRLRSGTLAVPGRPAAPAAVLEVADEGPGLPPEQAQRVFERFYRADQARTRQKGGTGLGLAIVAALVAAHGGTVAVDTAAGRGATFRITLPLAPETQED